MEPIKILFQIICFHQIQTFDISPDSPVPHSERLNDFLGATYFKNYTETNSISVFDYLFGDNFTDLDNREISDHLDICVLSPENIKKVVEQAQSKYLLAMRSFNETFKGKSRRYYDYIYYGNKKFKIKAMDWMKQSIYGTRRRLEVTRPFRKKFHNDISYNIGILYGILNEMMIKLDSLHTSMYRIHFHFHYIWFILAYQRILGFNVDITYIVERMFEFQKKWNVLIGRKEKGEYDDQSEAPLLPVNDTAMLPDLGVDLWIGQGQHPGAGGPGPEGGPGSIGPQGQQPAPGDIQGPHMMPGAGPDDGSGNKYVPGFEGGPGQYGGPNQHGGPGSHYGPGQYGGPNQHGGPGSHYGPGPPGGPGSQVPNQHGGPDLYGGPGAQGGPGSQGGPAPQGGPGPQGGWGQYG